MYSSAVSPGVDLFALKFYVDKVVPINHSWRQKTRDTGLYPIVRPHLSAFPRFDTILACDGQTDGGVCRSIYSACKAMLCGAL